MNKKSFDQKKIYLKKKKRNENEWPKWNDILSKCFKLKMNTIRKVN